ncbi:MAG TPA: amino acid adenylation domain-containing protein, partial [Thermoanaerobaculia bacterium]
ELPIDRLSLLTEAAAALLPDPRRPLGDAWMGAVHERFAEAARRSPERLAVVDRDEAWSYRDLELRANRLAAFLLRGGVGRGDVVAIYGHRSVRLVWAVMAVMKAGAVLTILDPAHPPARLVDCLDVAAPRAFLAVAAAGPPAAAVAEHVRATVPCHLALPPADAEDDPFVDGPADDPCVPVGPDDLAYVAFTSGSTGLPKGILGRHGPLSHFLPWQRTSFGLGETDRFSMLSGLSHDPLQRDMFTPLQMGAVLCVPDPEEIFNPGRLAEWMRREAITVAHLTPAMGQLMTERAAGAPLVRLPALRWAFFVGDVLTRRDVARLEELAPKITCVNFSGSTETQRAVGYHLANRGPDGGTESGAGRRSNLPLGRGMEDVQLLVLTPSGRLAGVGEIGEIHVRSPHLARGYLGDPAATSLRFLTNPSTGLSGDRVYRTGDLGRYLPDGEVEFAGRADDQVKIRGFRVEPGEIEGWLGRHPGVRESIVLPREGEGGDRRLIAYVVAIDPDLSAADLRAFLRERLPEPTVPAAFVLLDRLPLTPNGKVDRRALSGMEIEKSAEAEAYTAPRNEVERTIAAILREALGVESIGAHDNFFEVGGNSLLLVRAHARLQERLGDRLQVIDLFSHPTVASLAEHCLESEAEAVAVAAEPRTDRIKAGQARLLKQRQRAKVGQGAEP